MSGASRLLLLLQLVGVDVFMQTSHANDSHNSRLSYQHTPPLQVDTDAIYDARDSLNVRPKTDGPSRLFTQCSTARTV